MVGIDVGSQSIRAIAFRPDGAKIATAARSTPVIARGVGEADYDPDLVFDTVVAVLGELAAKLDGRPVAGLAVASVGESCVIVGADGRALAPVVAWFDRRTEPQARELAAITSSDRMFALTGLPLDRTLSLFKLAWTRTAAPEAFAATHRVLMMADWVAYRLCGVAATDPTLASRTGYFDIHRRAWSEELLGLVGLDGDVPAPLAPGGTALGQVRADLLARTGLAGRPVVAVGGHDDLCGAYATGLAAPGILINSQGTGEALLVATTAAFSDPAVVRSGYMQGAIGLDDALFYLGGGIVSSGGAVEWLRAILGGATHEALIAEAAQLPPGSGGIVFLPHLGNSPPPHHDSESRGAFVGLATEATRGALYRAVLEGLAMQVRLILDGMTGLPGVSPPTEIRVIGGGTRNPLALSIRANALGRPITVINEAEATTLGAALLGGIGAGLWPDLNAALAGLNRETRVIEPDRAADRYDVLRREVFEDLYANLRSVNRGLAVFRGAE